MSKKLKIDPISLFSHELKTSLNSLKIAIHLLKKYPDQKDILDLMDKELNKVIHFIQNQLDDVFLKKKNHLYNLEWSSWDAMIQSLSLSFSFILKSHHVHLKINNNSCFDLEVFMDSVWMEQMLKNLIMNAIKESPKNGNVYLSYTVTHEGLEVSIQGEGKGISTKAKVAKTKGKNKDSFEGLFKDTGLGLMISKDIASVHGAKIKIQSRDKGWHLLFTLPKIKQFQKSA